MIEEIIMFVKENIFALITVGIAIIALFQTNKQIKISNKQHLFDRRLKNYSIVSGLIRLYEENEWLIKEEHKIDEPLDVDFLFYGLINNSYLEELYTAIEHPLEQPYQKQFLIKLEDLMIVANEVKFIYGKFEEIIEFVLNYKEVLHSIYKYKNLQNEINASASKLKKTYKEMQKIYKENNHREKLLKSYSNLVKSYEKVQKNKSISKIEKEIKL